MHIKYIVFIQQALAVSLAIFTMMIFDCVHPPGTSYELVTCLYIILNIITI